MLLGLYASNYSRDQSENMQRLLLHIRLSLAAKRRRLHVSLPATLVDAGSEHCSAGWLMLTEYQ